MKTFFFCVDSYEDNLDVIQFNFSNIEKDRKFDPYFTEDGYPIGVSSASHRSGSRTVYYSIHGSKTKIRL